MATPTTELENSNCFIKNKYFKWYIALIENAYRRTISEEVYFENHHYIPKSFGGINVVKLTAKEHFICHLILIKITEGDNKRKMQFALTRLVHGNKKTYCNNSRLYDVVKKNNSLASSERSRLWWNSLSKEQKSFMGKGSKNSMFGKKHSAQSIKKMSAAKIGLMVGDKHPLWKKGHSEFTKQKIKNSKAKNPQTGDKNPMWGKDGAAKGKKWYHNSLLMIEKYFVEGTQPEGFTIGRLRNGSAN